MADFLNEDQEKKLSNLGYEVKPKCFRNVLYQDEMDYHAWIALCEIAGVSPSCESVTLLSIAVKEESED